MPPVTEPLTAERVLDAAEETLRRYGPAKTTVVDVARALTVSHGSVYRHFPSKAALRDAVTRRWLDRISAPLEEVVAGTATRRSGCGPGCGCSPTRSRASRGEDPELFATFRTVTDEAREVVGAHVDHLAAQLAQIVQDGVVRRSVHGRGPAGRRPSRAPGHGTVPPPGTCRPVGRPSPVRPARGRARPAPRRTAKPRLTTACPGYVARADSAGHSGMTWLWVAWARDDAAYVAERMVRAGCCGCATDRTRATRGRCASARAARARSTVDHSSAAMTDPDDPR